MLQRLTIGLLSLPALWLGGKVLLELANPGTQFGADPGEAVTEYLGSWAMRILILALCLTPLRRLSGVAQLAPLRRTLGLFAFGYAMTHMLAYLGLLATFDAQQMLSDFTQRSYIIAGLGAIVLLLPLSITSTRSWQRRLGRRWRTLHRLVFAAGLCALLHLFWLTKDGYAEPLLYAVMFALAVGERLFNWLRRRLPAVPVPSR